VDWKIQRPACRSNLDPGLSCLAMGRTNHFGLERKQFRELAFHDRNQFDRDIIHILDFVNFKGKNLLWRTA
jgi:hypothetical protein